MQPDDPSALSANDRTQFMPRPGGRSPQPAASAPAQPLPLAAAALASGQAQGLNPLEQAAGPLLALLTRLRSTLSLLSYFSLA